MEVKRDDRRREPASAVDGNGRSIRRIDRRGGRSRGSPRSLARVGAGLAGLVGLSGTAGAHGSLGHGGGSISVGVVVGLPVVVGLGAGAIVVHGRRGTGLHSAGHRLGVVTGPLLLLLGVTFAMTAIAANRLLGIGVSALGVLLALWVGRREGSSGRSGHADVTLGAVSVHRLVEGVALGAVYSSGVVVGSLAAVGVAGHAALETAAVGGLYSPHRLRASAAVVLVQVGYAVGTLVGVGLAASVPVPVQVGAAALAGGILLGVGTNETRHSAVAHRLDPLG